MKVPNRVLQAVSRLLEGLPDSEDKKTVAAWANEGLARRAALSLGFEHAPVPDFSDGKE